jgi:hypothetical protein
MQSNNCSIPLSTLIIFRLYRSIAPIKKRILFLYYKPEFDAERPKVLDEYECFLAFTSLAYRTFSSDHYLLQVP